MQSFKALRSDAGVFVVLDCEAAVCAGAFESALELADFALLFGDEVKTCPILYLKNLARLYHK